MTYHIITGEQLTHEHLEQIHALDVRAYDGDVAGETTPMEVRLKLNPKTYVCVADELENIVAYINFFPISYTLYNYIIEQTEEMVDDELAYTEWLDENLCYTSCSKENPANNIFILSVVNIKSAKTAEALNNHKELSDAERIECKIIASLLQNSFRQYLTTLENNGFWIKSITGCVVSDGGEQFASRQGMELVRVLADGHKVFSKLRGYVS